MRFRTTQIAFALYFTLINYLCAQNSTSTRWVSGYVTSWDLNMTGIPGGAGAANNGNTPYAAIDLDAMTHVIVFTAGLDKTGTMETKKEWDNSVTWGGTLLEKKRKPFNDYVHSKGKPVLCTIFGVGGGGDWTKLLSTPQSRTKSIKTIIDLVIIKEQYDGVDLDIEPLAPVDTANFRLWFYELRDSLNKYHAFYDGTKKLMITAAILQLPTFWARVAPLLDQINIMTYDNFGTWTRKVWHNNPVFAGSDGTDIWGDALTSAQNKTQSCINAGIPKEKLGLGIVLGNGYIWKGGLLANFSGDGITAPLQMWIPGFQPSKLKYNEYRYYELRKDYIDTATTTIHFDNIRKVPYIGIDNPGYKNDLYITFEDTTTAKELVILADTMNLGGMILWEVNGGYLNEARYPSAKYPGLVRDPFLKTIKKTMIDISLNKKKYQGKK
ncbi:MAG: glycoside hydrolase family 18 protein [Bacteroidota bacterium]|nr:glycoside hydrolase family 18 protein [Bacteroidota bacterium]